MKYMHRMSLFLIIVILLTSVTVYPVDALPLVETNEPMQYLQEQLRAANSDRLLGSVKHLLYKEVVSIQWDTITNCSYMSSGQIKIVYQENNVEREAIYLEVDRIRKKHVDQRPADILAETSAAAVGSRLGLDRLASLVSGNGTITVAVLDTGIDMDHPDFKDRLVKPYDAIDDDAVPTDTDGHGTHVAGIITANTPTNVKIMPIRIFEKDNAAPDSAIVKGIYYAVRNGSKVINLSIGGIGASSYMDKAMAYARAKGVLVIASSGNEAEDCSATYPAAYDSVITVGATSGITDHLYYSNTGSALDICAPGEKILSTGLDGEPVGMSGTSMAAPFVSAAASMLWLENLQQSAAEVRQRLLENTRDMGASGKDIAFGQGILSYGQYKENPNFYMIGSIYDNAKDKATLLPECKFDINLRYWISPQVKEIVYWMDGAEWAVAPVSGASVIQKTLDIRQLAEGQHQLMLQARMKSGELVSVYEQAFVVPAFNVRVKSYDITDEAILRPDAKLLRFFNDGQDIAVEWVRDNTSQLIEMNLDFTKIAQKGGLHKLSISSEDDFTPFYLRTLCSGGERVFEAYEAQWLEFQTPGYSIMQPMIKLSLYASSINGYNAEKAEVSSAEIFPVRQTGMQFLFPDEKNPTDKKGLFVVDTCNAYLALSGVLSTDLLMNQNAESQLNRLDARTDIILVANSVDNLADLYEENDDIVIDVKELHEFSVSVSQGVAFQSGNVDVKDPMIGSILFSQFENNVYNFIAPSGIYTLQGSVWADNYLLSKLYTKKVVLGEDEPKALVLGEQIISQLSTTHDTRYFFVWFEDQYQTRLNLLATKNGANDTVNGEFLLTEEGTGRKYTLKSTYDQQALRSMSEYPMSAYSLAGIPDGNYRAEHLLEENVLTRQRSTIVEQVEIRNGRIVNQGKSPPASTGGDYVNSFLGDVVVIDLRPLVTDDKPEDVSFMADKGIIVGDYWYYDDELGQDTVVTIVAFDKTSGQVSMRIAVNIDDERPIGDGFEPIAEIVSAGASVWAFASIAHAIDAGIVTNELLNDYQVPLTREEMCEQIVELLESSQGTLQTSTAVFFTDTSNPAVRKLASLGIVKGTGNGLFEPELQITRQQFCTIVYAVAKYQKKAGSTLPAPSGFRDWVKVAVWAKEGTQFCIEKEIMLGSNGYLQPDAAITREQAIAMLVRYQYMGKTLPTVELWEPFPVEAETTEVPTPTVAPYQPTPSPSPKATPAPSGKTISGTIRLPNGEVAPAGGLLVGVYCRPADGVKRDWYGPSIVIPEGKNAVDFNFRIESIYQAYNSFQIRAAIPNYLDDGTQYQKTPYSNLDNYYSKDGTVSDIAKASSISVSYGAIVGIDITMASLADQSQIRGMIHLPKGHVAPNGGILVSVSCRPADGTARDWYGDHFFIPKGMSAVDFTLIIAPIYQSYQSFQIQAAIPNYLNDGTRYKDTPYSDVFNYYTKNGVVTDIEKAGSISISNGVILGIDMTLTPR